MHQAPMPDAKRGFCVHATSAFSFSTLENIGKVFFFMFNYVVNMLIPFYELWAAAAVLSGSGFLPCVAAWPH